MKLSFSGQIELFVSPWKISWISLLLCILSQILKWILVTFLFSFFPISLFSFFFLNKSETIGTFCLDFSIIPLGFSPFYCLLCLNWCIIDLQYSVGFRCSTQWFDIFIHYKMNTRINLVNTCHHTESLTWVSHAVYYVLTTNLIL